MHKGAVQLQKAGMLSTNGKKGGKTTSSLSNILSTGNKSTPFSNTLNKLMANSKGQATQKNQKSSPTNLLQQIVNQKNNNQKNKITTNNPAGAIQINQLQKKTGVNLNNNVNQKIATNEIPIKKANIVNIDQLQNSKGKKVLKSQVEIGKLNKALTNQPNMMMPVKKGNKEISVDEIINNKKASLLNLKADVPNQKIKDNFGKFELPDASNKKVVINPNAGMNAYKMNDINEGLIRPNANLLKIEKSLEKQGQNKIGQNLDNLSNVPKDNVLNITQLHPEVGVASTPAKVFDINHLSPNIETNEVIEKVSNYILQASSNNRAQLKITFSHQDLGLVDLKVSKEKRDSAVNIQIGTRTIEGKEFFAKNHDLLVQSLTSSGIKVGDIRLDNRELFNQEKDSTSGQHFAQNDRQGYNDRGRDRDSERRKDLWEQFQNKDVA